MAGITSIIDKELLYYFPYAILWFTNTYILLKFQTAALVSSAIPFLTFIGVLFIPESPSWLVRKKQNFHGARKAILKLNRDTLSFAEEV